eukprot:COSAG02_NODE_3195_length_7193_cov_1.529462_4_plen_48_part_00
MMKALLLVHAAGGLSMTVQAAFATLPPHPMRSAGGGAPGLYCQYVHV